MQTNLVDFMHNYNNNKKDTIDGLSLSVWLVSGDIRKLALTYGGEIVIKVSNNVLHQISSRVFGILASEILNYDVKYEDIHFSKNPMQLTEKEKLFETLQELMYVCIAARIFIEPKLYNFQLKLSHFSDREYSFIKRKPALNLGVWMPADYHMPPPGVDMVGRFSTGRFGWFIPKNLIGEDGSSSVIPYTIFKDTNSIQYQRFLYDEHVLRQL